MTLVPTPVQKSSTGTSRSPAAPAMTQMPRSAIMAGMVSAAGDELHRLPPKEARPWIWVEPMRSADSIRPGRRDFSSSFSFRMALGMAAPM